MSRSAKLLERIKSTPRDFTWDEAKQLLAGLGYALETGSGARRRFVRADGVMISLHEPHPQKVLKLYQVRDILKHLKQEGLV